MPENEAPALDAASAAVRGADRDEDSLSLTVPGDGSLGSLRALVDQLDRAEAWLAGQGVTVEPIDA